MSQIWSGVTDDSLTHSQTLKDRATQLLIKYKSGAISFGWRFLQKRQICGVQMLEEESWLMRAHLEEIVGATGDIEGTGALIIHQPEEFVKEEHFGRFFIKLKWFYDHFSQQKS